MASVDARGNWRKRNWKRMEKPMQQSLLAALAESCYVMLCHVMSCWCCLALVINFDIPSYALSYASLWAMKARYWDVHAPGWQPLCLWHIPWMLPGIAAMRWSLTLRVAPIIDLYRFIAKTARTCKNCRARAFHPDNRGYSHSRS